MNKACQGIPSNPDISGIGVRVNIYTTMLITAGCPRMRWATKLLNSLNENAAMTTLGLLITAIVQTFQKKLDLYHAIFVFHIIYSLGVIVYFSGLFRNITSQFRPASRALIQVVILGSFLGWSAYVWAHAKTFGSSPECNAQIIYFFLFVPVRATATWLRVVWVYSLAVTVGTTLIGIFAVVMWTRKTNINEDDFDIEGHTLSTSCLISGGLTTAAILAIVLLELLVHRNKHLILPGEGDWAFGQVLSIVMIVSSLREILDLIRYTISTSRNAAIPEVVPDEAAGSDLNYSELATY